MMTASARPGRMEPIATLPVFLKLRGRLAVLAGGTPPAVWKAELLAAAGASVTILAADPCPELLALVDGTSSVTLHRRPWQPADLAGAAVALGAIEDDEEAERFRAAAQGAGVPVNVIDKPAFCDFQFGTVVSRSPLMIGISTDGAAPVFGQAIRARIEALLPQSLKGWAEAARDWRPAVQALNLDFRGRRRFWEAFSERALATPDAQPDEADRAACMQSALGTAELASGRQITLVGAGRGTPEGITLEAVKALQDADLVVFNGDLAPPLVGYARREAEKVLLEPPSDISAIDEVMRLLAHGRRTVWLDRGNPLACLRWDERGAALGSAGITIARIEGLGQCQACRPGCPSWRG